MAGFFMSYFYGITYSYCDIHQQVKATISLESYDPNTTITFHHHPTLQDEN
jgi:hypothetical protein